MVKTTPRICNRKRSFATREEAEGVAARADITLRAYKCELCKRFHLTSRTKGMKLPAFEVARRRKLRNPI